MVQILKPQMRNYQADQTAAIKQQQMTQFISDVGGVVQGVANIYNAYQRNEQQRTREAEQADQDIINTEMGDKADYDLTAFNVENIGKGQDVSSQEYIAKLEAKSQEVYKPWYDQMTTEAGRNKVLEMARKSVDKLKKANLGSVAKLQKSSQAQQAVKNVQQSIASEAFDFGQLGDFDSFAESIADKKEAVVAYQESQGVPRELAEAQVDLDVAKNFALGWATNDPESLLQFLGDEDYKNAQYEKLKKRFPDSEESRLRALANISADKDMYKNKDKASKMYGTFTQQYKDAYIKGLEGEKQALLEEQKQFKQGTPNYRKSQERIAEIDKMIANPDEEVEKGLREMMAKVVLPVARAEYKKQQAQAAKEAEKETLQTYVATLSPDVVESANASLIIGEKNPVDILKEKLNFIGGDTFFNKEYYDLSKAYDNYKAKKDERLARQSVPQTAFKATQSMVNGLKKVFANDGRTDAAVMSDAFTFSGGVIGNTDMSDDDAEQMESVLYMGVRDRVFGGEIARVLNNADTYYPDLGFMETYWASDIKDNSGVIMGNKTMHKTSRDNVKNFIEDEVQKTYKATMGMFEQASRLPESERASAMNKIEKFILDEKKRIYGTALSEYGINIKELQEAKNTKGFAYAKIGFRIVEFKGLLDNGTPIFDDIDSTAESKLLAERIEGIKKMSKKEQ
jgi:hypothetical protein